jgi:predicted metal-binding membrane protein
MTEVTVVESALRRDRWWVASALAIAIALCWSWIVPMARDMYGAMDGASAWMMAEIWDLPHVLLLFAMWQVMMAGMMLPSAAPTLLLYANVVRRSGDGLSVPLRVYAFAAGYLLAWGGFSLIATVLQRALADGLLLSMMMQAQGRVLGSALLLVAGVYQLTPMKRTCLESCRSPAAYIASHWRRGVAGALRMGLGHGLFCVGCCWALMLLLFVGGVMNLYWIAAITVFVLLEKLAPAGVQGGRLSGVALIVLGIVTAWRGLPF